MKRKGVGNLTLVQKWENRLDLVKANIKLVTLNNIGVAAVLLFILPFIQGVENLDPVSSAICLENYVSVIGIILLVPIFAPEEATEINEIVTSKSMSQCKIYGVRIIIGLISIFILVTAFTLMLKHNNCDFPLLKYILGTFLSAIFLGSVGLFTSAISRSTIFGYMGSIIYLILNIMTKNKYVGKFYIMSMGHKGFNEKYWLLAGSAILILASPIIKFLKRKME
ncbi:ABC transporter permease [Clostridium algidicarnis]|nr:ABC transporter permease [Clostridium algidicarnis]